MLNLALSDDDQLVQEVARDFLKENVTPTAIREAELSPDGFDANVWRQIQELGWNGLPFSEAAGGEGASMVMTAVLAEELGRGCYPGPIRAGWAYGLLLQELGDTARLREHIAGKAFGVPALWEADDAFNADSTAASLNPDGTITGAKVLVAYANAASRYGVLCKDSAGALRLAIVEADQAERIATPSSSGDRYFAIKLHNAQPLHVYGAESGEALKRALTKIVAIDCAWMAGLVAKAWELTIDYVKGRIAFGRPIGAFQAVQHKIVDVGVIAEGGRFLAYKAAWASDATPEQADLACSYAKGFLNASAEQVVKDMFQVTGAMGMTYEYDLHLALRRLKASSVSHGSYHDHRASVLAAMPA